MADLLLDLNADLGEECGDDVAMLDLVTSVNVACGGHAGGGRVLLGTMRAAVARGLTIGAHPSYPDRANFGRVSMGLGPAALRATLRGQIMVAQEAAVMAGGEIAYVKPHGALYNDLAADARLADLVAGVVAACQVSVLMGLAGSEAEAAAERAGIGFRAEVFADRAYLSSGALVPRSQPGAVLHDPVVVAARVRRMATEGVVVAVDGVLVPVRPESVCVHGDSPGAVALARAVRAALTA